MADALRLETASDANPFQFGLQQKPLRTFFRDISRYSNQKFLTTDAMAALGLREPEATRVLLKMAENNWLVYLGEHDGIDKWSLGRLGIQFSLKNFFKRIDVSSADKILAKAIVAAREFNDREASLTIIQKITLYGSLARGGDSAGTVGDIDLQIELDDRIHLSPEEVREQLRLHGWSRGPRHLRYDFEAEGWAASEGLRVLRAVNHRITASTIDNIGEMGCEHRVVYEYDIASRSEILCSGELVPADAQKQAQFNKGSDHKSPLPVVPEFRAWPEWPRDRSAIGALRRRINANVAQYHWQRGMTCKQIAKLTRCTETEIQAVLANLNSPTPEPSSVELIASPVEALIPFHANFPGSAVSVQTGVDRDFPVSVWFTQNDKTARADAGKIHANSEGPDAAAVPAELIARAAALWFAGFKPSFPKIELHMGFSLHSGALTTVNRSKPLHAKRFATSFNRLFDELLMQQPIRDHYGEDSRYLSLTFDLNSMQFTEASKVPEDLICSQFWQLAELLRAEIVGAHPEAFSSIRMRRSEFKFL